MFHDASVVCSCDCILLPPSGNVCQALATVATRIRYAALAVKLVALQAAMFTTLGPICRFYRIAVSTLLFSPRYLD